MSANTIQTRTLALTMMLGAASGCGSGGEAAATPPMMTTPVQVSSIGAPAADSALQLTLTGGSEGASVVRVGITAMTLCLQNGARPSLIIMEAPLQDLATSGGADLPSGLELRELTLEQPGPLTIARSTDDEILGSTSVQMQLQWSERLSDGSWDPKPVLTAPLQLNVDVQRDAGGATRVTLDGSCTGGCWILDGLAVVRDAVLHVDAAAVVTTLE